MGIKIEISINEINICFRSVFEELSGIKGVDENESKKFKMRKTVNQEYSFSLLFCAIYGLNI